MGNKIITITLVLCLILISGCKKDSDGHADQVLVNQQGSTSPENTLTHGTLKEGETKYLLFQVFIGEENPEIPLAAKSSPLSPPHSKKVIADFVQNIIDTIGTTGDERHKLGFVVGPLALDYTDDQLRQVIQDAFAIAREKNIAVAFHIDDSIFWLRRSDLWNDKNNVEWTDWKGTPHPQRYIGWAKNVKLAPQMCYTSVAIRKEVGRIAKDVIGFEIKNQVKRLIAENKVYLFAGVIAGWETNIFNVRQGELDPDLLTQMKQDGSPNVPVGYCALTGRGFSKEHPPKNFVFEVLKAVQDWADFWAKSLNEAGIPKEKIYTHVPVSPANKYIPVIARIIGVNFDEYGVAWTAFNQHSRPGFTTYSTGLDVNGTDVVLATIFDELSSYRNPAWASAESANVARKVGMETYLAQRYNHGAQLVNIFAWGIGGEELKRRNDPFRIATEGKEAIHAYQKFLNGDDGGDGDDLVESGDGDDLVESN